ncbi:MAG: hypothetical protein JXQ85_05480 [Cognatishimia sp.]|uniref:hypothetical protein n=1 Tax=Cognatishimia sp. TaxID=2211648 RepID=UPI003B8E0500
MRRLLTIFIGLGLAGPTLADVISPKGKVIDCYCTDRTGSRIELGEYTCINVDGRMFTAQCQMSLNVPMWREISPGCLSSENQKLPMSVSPEINAG